MKASTIILGSGLFVSCLKMPFLGFPCSFVHQARRSKAHKVGWQTGWCSACSVVCWLGNKSLFLFCLMVVGRSSIVPSWSCHDSKFLFNLFWRWSSLFFKQKSASFIGSIGWASAMMQLCFSSFALDYELSIITSVVERRICTFKFKYIYIKSVINVPLKNHICIYLV